MGYPHSDHCPVIYSFHNIGLLRYSLNINELTLKSHQRDITSSVRSSPASKEKARFSWCYCSIGLRSVIGWNFSCCSVVPVVPIVIRVHSWRGKDLNIKNSREWRLTPHTFHSETPKPTKHRHCRQHHHHSVILREAWGERERGLVRCSIFMKKEERRMEASENYS